MSDWEIVREPESEWEIVKQEPEKKISPLLSLGVGAGTALNEGIHGLFQNFLENKSGVNPSAGMEKFGYGDPFADFREKLKQGSIEHAANRRALYEKSKEQNPLSTMLGYGGLKVAPDLAAAYFTGGGSQAANLPKYLKYLKMALAGGLTGGVGGGLEYVNPGESKEENMLRGALIGAAAPFLPEAVGLGYGAAKSAGKYLKNIPKALDKEALIKDVLKGAEQAENINTRGFGVINSASEKIGIKTQPPQKSLSKILDLLPEKEGLKVIEYLDNPSIPNAHEVYKDLGIEIRELGKLGKTAKESSKGFKSHQKDELRALQQAQEELKQSMMSAFDEYGAKDLGNLFNHMNKHYIENVLPHRNRYIDLYKRGKRTGSDFIKDLSADKTFRAEKGMDYPALAVRKSLPSVAKFAGIGAIGGPTAYNYLFK